MSLIKSSFLAVFAFGCFAPSLAIATTQTIPKVGDNPKGSGSGIKMSDLPSYPQTSGSKMIGTKSYSKIVNSDASAGTAAKNATQVTPETANEVGSDEVVNWQQEYTDSDSFGGSNFGASWYYDIFLQARAGSEKDFAIGRAELKAEAKILGDTKSIFHAIAKGYSGEADDTTTGYGTYDEGTEMMVDIDALGNDIYSNSWDSHVDTTLDLFDQNLFSASAQFTIWIIPVTVTASAHASAGIDLEADLSLFHVDAGATPWVNANAVGTVGVGFVGASAGVYTSLNLVQVKTPVDASLNWTDDSPTFGNSVKYNVGADLTLKTLSGEFGVYANLGQKYWYYPIAEWPAAASTTVSLIDISGRYPS